MSIQFMKNGFTLVELSIVLVIIGLLIGGILVGQSMIDTARINAQIRQIQQFDIAVNNFVGKYNSIPGDSLLFEYPGNGDGILMDSYDTQQIYTGEYRGFWKHMTETELSGLYEHDNSTNSIRPNINAPQGEIEEESVVLGLTSNGEIFPLDSLVWHIRNEFPEAYHLFDDTESRGRSSPLTVLQAMNLDAKMDDGNAITGDVRASDGKRTGQSWGGGATELGCVVVADNSLYDINRTVSGASETPCGMLIKMQVN